MSFLYHPSKANVVADALSRLLMGSVSYVENGATKMYCDLWEVYWWNGMKKDIAEFVAKCPNCQQVKFEHQVVWLKTLAFLLGSAEDYAQLYIRKMVRLHVVPLSIISDRDTQFLRSFQKGSTGPTYRPYQVLRSVKGSRRSGLESWWNFGFLNFYYRPPGRSIEGPQPIGRCP
ncbi:hypothetical protein MTR67_047813 [Solanum verrucosum]|uniref:Integrase zinc-binding domain-containing protein n=1 Tax=Solanum verrucosum TaxID=315347 RepID=A0AAF0UWH2_SOLVR|nr:hypothetical protein MTR67_047813 [Solanum verrucosum]